METLATHFVTLLKMSGQASVMILLVLAVQWACGRRLHPRWRCALWFLVIARLALPWTVPSPTSLFNAVATPSNNMTTQFEQTTLPEIAVADSDNNAFPAVAAESAPTVAQGHSWAYWLMCVWAAGAISLAGCAIASQLRFNRQLKGIRPHLDKRALHLLEDSKAAMGIRASITLIECDAAVSPALSGYMRPQILLPSGLAASFSEEEMRHVFMHELAHVKRHDIFVGWVMLVLQIAHWFNPLVWMAGHRLRIDREMACDALALSREMDGKNQSYGLTIVKLLERFGQPGWAPGQARILEHHEQMKERINMIAQFNKSTRGRTLAACLFAALVLAALTDAQTNTNSIAPKTEKDFQSDFQKQLALAESGNPWAMRRVSNAYLNGDGTERNQVKADKWLNEFVEKVWIVRFEPSGNSAPQTPDQWREVLEPSKKVLCADTNCPVVSYFRTTKQGEKLAGSFLAIIPEKVKAELEKIPNVRVVALQRLTPASFIQYDASAQESLTETMDVARDVKLAESGNQWAMYRLWEAFSSGKHGVKSDPAAAQKWLNEFVKDLWVVRFEPEGPFSPKSPGQFLSYLHQYSGRSGETNVGVASFFRTTRKDKRLVGSFLSQYPDVLKDQLAKAPNLKVTSAERMTTENFVKYNASTQESLTDSKNLDQLRIKFNQKTAQDRAKYSTDQLAEAEQLYQVANNKWGTVEAAESLEKMIAKYPDINRTGCAVLYVAQHSAGDKKVEYLTKCIEKFNDCYYGDGVQVGAYARLFLAQIYKSTGEDGKAAALLDELTTKFSNAVDHSGNPLMDSVIKLSK